VTYKATAVVAHSFSFPDFTFSQNVSGAVSNPGDVGKAVSVDPATPNTVKLAADGDAIHGRLESVETGGLDGLTIGAVSRKFRAILPTSGVVAVGDSVVGAGGGLVKAAAAPNATLVLEVLTGNRAVVELL
jgi:hypothetical protein